MIVAMPLAIPKIVPDNWEVFEKIWNEHSKPLVKVAYKEDGPYKSASGVGDANLWNSLDIYRSQSHNTIWDAPFFDIKDALPNMYKSILNLPVEVQTVRIISSIQEILPHSDTGENRWEIRAFLRCEDPLKEWYFTPLGRQDEKTYFKMPEDTNWFAYNDSLCHHGSHVNIQIPKLLIQVYYSGNLLDVVKYVSISKYREYIINFDEVKNG